MNKRPLFFGVTALAVAFPVIAIASPVDIPNAFDDGDPIAAEEFNENFDAIADAINDNDARIAALEAAVVDGGVPAGTIAFFATAGGPGAGGCPDGWGVYAELGGRVPVGLVPGGMIGFAAGDALDDQGTVEIDDVPTHTHLAGGTGTATSGSSDHSHTLSNGAHQNHEITANSGTHDHEIRVNTGGFGTSAVIGGLSAGGTPMDTFTPIQGGGGHSHSMAPQNATNTLGSHSHTVTGGNHTHSVTINGGSTGNNPGGVASVDVTMPYIQLLACEKL